MDNTLMCIEDSLLTSKTRQNPLRIPDFVDFVKRSFGPDIASYTRAACVVRDYSNRLGLTIISVQPFTNFDGLICPEEKKRIKTAFTDVWVEISDILDVKMVGVPASYGNNEDSLSGNPNLISQDVNWISKVLWKSPGVKVGYEALCFSKWITTWQAALKIINDSNYKSVTKGRPPSTKLIIDTFNLCGSTIANPTTPKGLEMNGHLILGKSLHDLKKAVAVNKGIICLVQVADAKRLMSRTSHSHGISEKEAKMNWSRNHRLFPGEKKRGAYLPVLEILREITNPDGIGYKGYISLEVFMGPHNEELIDKMYHSMAASYRLDHAGALALPTAVALECGHRARTSWMLLCAELGWQSDWTPKIGVVSDEF
ncbi:3-dehydroshikimate dehydratase [Ceratocystis fimbriata CBS 114723]|uniref:3-dehydroshikimate dehydratase n=1 Tax=Ceratocystis fimbriata CBS 114723 TaxID=1035309 RepID=A0A2C5WXE3_9PEZI|nr:3-dehydroshikimate dehydratase [Ceratocystis fimbriata CBS 114723]